MCSSIGANASPTSGLVQFQARKKDVISDATAITAVIGRYREPENVWFAARPDIALQHAAGFRCRLAPFTTVRGNGRPGVRSSGPFVSE